MFLRVHRSAIVNIERVKKLVPAPDGSLSIILHNATADPPRPDLPRGAGGGPRREVLSVASEGVLAGFGPQASRVCVQMRRRQTPPGPPAGRGHSLKPLPHEQKTAILIAP